MTGRGRPPKPTALHRAKGTYREDRHGQRIAEAEDGVPLPPEHLTADERAAWDEVLGQALKVPGLVTLADGVALEGLTIALVRWRTASAAVRALGSEDVAVEGSHGLRLHPAFAHEATTWSHLRSCLALFGMTPPDRAKLRLPEGADDPWANLLGDLSKLAAAARGGDDEPAKPKARSTTKRPAAKKAPAKKTPAKTTAAKRTTTKAATKPRATRRKS